VDIGDVLLRHFDFERMKLVIWMETRTFLFVSVNVERSSNSSTTLLLSQIEKKKIYTFFQCKSGFKRNLF
jgi:hypothetical protein